MYFRSSLHQTSYPRRFIWRMKSSRLTLVFMTSPMWYMSRNFQLWPFRAARYSLGVIFFPPFL